MSGGGAWTVTCTVHVGRLGGRGVVRELDGDVVGAGAPWWQRRRAGPDRRRGTVTEMPATGADVMAMPTMASSGSVADTSADVAVPARVVTVAGHVATGSPPLSPNVCPVLGRPGVAGAGAGPREVAVRRAVPVSCSELPTGALLASATPMSVDVRVFAGPLVAVKAPS